MKLSTAKDISLKTMIGLLTLLLLFHFCLIAKIIPYEIAWGGRLKNDAQMYIFEIISILINGVLITVLLLKVNYIKHEISEKIINGILWLFVALFALNTIGNILAKTCFEKSFAVLTFVSALLIWIILKKKK
ncbi:MAG: hypothetical protein ACOH2V_14065 [Candidatus Saccharimonadaceae bacterium]